MGEDKKNQNLKLEHISFYFDCQEKDAFDGGRLARKTAQVLQVRNKLMNLDQEEFDRVIEAIERLLVGKTSEVKGPADRRQLMKTRQKEAMDMYEKATGKNSN